MLETALVDTENVVDLLPAGTTTDGGTTAFESLDERLTVVPKPIAVFETVTVPVAVLPPKTEDGLTETEATLPKLEYLETKPDQIMGPQPESVSQPTPAVEVVPSGRVPFVPDMTSKKTLESPLK